MPMSRKPSLAGSVLWLVMAPALAFAQGPACGPDFTLDGPGHATALAAKRAHLAAQNYPTELLALLDRGSRCVAAVERSPDGFSLRTVAPGAMTTMAWSADADRIARQQLRQGQLSAFYLMHAAQRFACCNEPAHDQQPDWDATLGLNTGQALICTLAAGTVACR